MKTELKLYRPNVLKNWNFSTDSNWIVRATSGIFYFTDNIFDFVNVGFTGFQGIGISGYSVGDTIIITQDSGFTNPEYNTTATITRIAVVGSDEFIYTDIPWAGNTPANPGSIVEVHTSEWTFTNNFAYYTNNGYGDILYQNALTTNVQYKVTFTVTARSSGSITVACGSDTYVVSSNGTFSTILTADSVQFSILSTANTGTKISLVSCIEYPCDYSVDLTSDISIPLTYSIADIREPDKRTNTYSKTVTIPGTKNNNKIFSQIFEISGVSNFNPNKKTGAVVLQDGLEIFNGILQLNNIVRTESLNGYDNISYEIILLGSLSDLFTSIGDDYLTDLDFSEYEHIWESNNIQASWFGQCDVDGITTDFYTTSLCDNYTISCNTSLSGRRVQLDIVGHSYSITDELQIINADTDLTQLNGYHTIFMISTDYIVLNYSWDSLNSPASYIGAAGLSCKIVTEGKGYVYPMIDYDGTSRLTTGWPSTNFYPALYVREYITKIFNKYGYSFNSDFFDSDFFKRLIIPYCNSADQLSHSEEFINENTFTAVQNTGDTTSVTLTTVKSGVAHFTTPIYSGPNISQATQPYVECDNDTTNGGFDPNGLYDITTFRYTHPITANTERVELKWSGDISMSKITSTGASTVSTVANDVLFTCYFWNHTTGQNCGQSSYINSTYGGYNNSYYSSALNLPCSYSTTAVLAPGDVVSCHIAFNQPATIWTPSIAGNIQYTCTIRNSRFSNGIPTYTEGDSINPTDFIPKNIKTKDFLIDIIRMFNLYIQQDQTNSNMLLIEPRQDFLLDNVTDWTSKLDTASLNIKPMAFLNGKDYSYEYKQDKDILNNDVQTSSGFTYGAEHFSIDNDFVKGKVENKLNVFSPTPLYEYFGQFNIPKITVTDSTVGEKAVNHNPRILFYGLRSTSKANPWYIQSNVNVIPQTNTLKTYYPYAGHLDNPHGACFDLNWTYPEKTYFTPISWTDNNLFNRFYSEFIYEISNKNSKIVECQLHLKPSDIASLSFRNIYLIDNTLYRLNKLEYNPGSELSKCEFIKAEKGESVDFRTYLSVDVSNGIGALGPGMIGY